MPDDRQTYRFREFELDVGGYELRRSGRPVRLERLPMDLLILLVRHRRQLVSRAEIIEALWSKDVFVDVETGVNTAVSKVRQALHDSADAAAFIETVPGKGYRFIASVAASHGSPDRPSPVKLAVLPFENIGHDPEREYLADGLTEEAIAALGQIDAEHLMVIGRTSTMRYKGTRKSLVTIGRQLGVDYLIEGSVRHEAGLLRIVVKLIRASDQAQVWVASYDRRPLSILGVQQELSTAIAEQCRLQLSPERANALSRRQTKNAEAYDLYLRGRRCWNQLTPATTVRAIEYYRAATELDPHYALAWAGISDAYGGSTLNGDAPPVAMWPLARDAASRAIQSDPNLSEAQNAEGQIRWWLEFDLATGESALQRAVELDPGNAWAQLMLAHLLSQCGRHGDASRLMERARELEPLSAFYHAISSQVAFQGRAYSAALVHARQAVVVDPDFWIGYMMLGQVYERLDEHAGAIDALTTAARLSAGNSKPVSLRGYILAKTGRLAEARELLTLLKGLVGTRYVPPYAMALIHAGLDERDDAFEWLDRAYAARDVHLMFLSVDVKWDPYRADPRFVTLMARCQFPCSV